MPQHVSAMTSTHRNDPTSARRSWKGRGAYGRPTWNQAAKIIAKFGGEQALAEAVGVHRVTPYRWQYARPYGTDGLIPAESIGKVQAAARENGIVLTPADWVPERISYEPKPLSLEEMMR